MPADRLKAGAYLTLAGAVFAIVFFPFEAREPLFRLGFTSFTTTETATLVFLLTVAVWAAGNLRAFFSRRVLDVAVLLFVASNLVSTIFSVDFNSSFRYSLRMTFAALVYLGISRLPVRVRSHLVVAGTVSATVLVVSVIGLLENFIPEFTWSRLLSTFQESVTTFGAYYNVRISSTMPFSTVLSAFLELCLPLFIVFGLWFFGERHGNRTNLWLAGAAMAGTACIIAAQLFSYTRSGFVTIPLSLSAGAVAAYVYGYGRRVWGMFIAVMVLGAVLFGASTLLNNKMGVRMGLSEQPVHFYAAYALLDMPSPLKLSEQYTATIRLKNTGDGWWQPSGEEEASLSYRWVDYPEGREQVKIPYLTSYMPHPVAPGETVDVAADFHTPGEPGRYVLVFDMVASRVAWFSADGSQPLVIPLEFTDEGEGTVFRTSEAAEDVSYGGGKAATPQRKQLWRAAVKVWLSHPLFGIGPDQFRTHYGEYLEGVDPDERLRTHNIFLEALSTTGVAGLAVMVYMLVSAFKVQLRLVRDRDMDKSARLVSLGVLAATVAYVAHGLLDSFLWQTGVAFMFFTILGLTAWLDKHKSTGPQRPA